MTIRPHGKASFLHIKDWTGKLQVYVKLNTVGEEKYEIFRLLDLGDVMVNEFKSVACDVIYVVDRPGDEVVHADNVMAFP